MHKKINSYQFQIIIKYGTLLSSNNNHTYLTNWKKSERNWIQTIKEVVQIQ